MTNQKIREAFEKWADETGNFTDEHYYFQGSQTRRHYNEDMWKGYQAALANAVPEWMPIETAPKDGTAFRAYSVDLIDLDFNPQGSVECAWNGEEFIGCVWNGQQDCWYGKQVSPTHWMPLPATPSPSEES